MKWLYGLTFIWIALGLAIFALLIFTQSAQAAQRCDFVVELVSVDGIPDDAKPGDIFRTTWLLRDKNGCGWPSGLQLLFADGNRMSGPASRDLSSPNRGEPLRVVFDVQAPDGEGEHVGIWRLALEGRELGPRLIVELQVSVPPVQFPSGGILGGPVVPETYMVTASQGVPIGSGENGNSTAYCPDGVVVGGGWLLTGTDTGAHVYISWKIDEDQGEGWTVSAHNPSFLQATLWARAICLRNTPGDTFTETYWGLTLSTFETAMGAVPCPSGSVLTGGGFIITGPLPGLVLRQSGPKWEGEGNPITHWSLEVHNSADTQKSAAQQAVCLTGVSASNSRADSSSVAVLPNDGGGPIPGYAVASCPAGTMPSSGGMAPLADTLFRFPSSGMAGNGWIVSAENADQAIQSFYSMVTCLSFP